MKNMVFLIAICCLTLPLSALDNESDKTTVTGKIITIELNQSTNSPVEVTLRDISGYRLLQESLQARQGGQRKYNLKNLPAGMYYLEIRQGFKVSTTTIAVKDINATVIKEETIYRPACSQKDVRWNVNLLLLDKDAELSIYDSYSELIYKESYDGQVNVAKSYNLSKLSPGTYQAVFDIEGEIFTESIFLN